MKELRQEDECTKDNLNTGLKLMRLMKELRQEDECTKDNLNTGLKLIKCSCKRTKKAVDLKGMNTHLMNK